MALVAIVDDSRLARMFAATALRKHGHEVIEIQPDTLPETLAILLERRPELLVLDHAMPAFQGPTLVRACFDDRRLAAIKVVMLTAFHDEAVAVRMAKLGVHAVLHKPILHEALTAAVDRVLAGEPPGGPA